MNRELVCIGCPMGCRLSVELKETKVSAVRGNSCPKGAEYAENECTNPTRMITTTIMIEGAMYPLLSVRSTKPIPKAMIMECVNYLREINVKAPVMVSQVIVKNILNTGCDIIATKNMARITEKT